MSKIRNVIDVEQVPYNTLQNADTGTIFRMHTSAHTYMKLDHYSVKNKTYGCANLSTGELAYYYGETGINIVTSIKIEKNKT